MNAMFAMRLTDLVRLAAEALDLGLDALHNRLVDLTKQEKLEMRAEIC